MIRALAAADFAAWEQLWLAYLRFYRADVSNEATAIAFRRLSEQTDGMIGLVATDDQGALVGLAHLVFHPSTWSANPYCYLEDLFVAPAARGTGTARQLLEAVFAEARKPRRGPHLLGDPGIQRPGALAVRPGRAPHILRHL
jgi:GNAT superfamily N-acetyltransferase